MSIMSPNTGILDDEEEDSWNPFSVSEDEETDVLLIREDRQQQQSNRNPHRRNRSRIVAILRKPYRCISNSFEWYMHALDTNPLLTKVVTACLISACGAILGQQPTKATTTMTTTMTKQDDDKHQSTKDDMVSSVEPFPVIISQQRNVYYVHKPRNNGNTSTTTTRTTTTTTTTTNRTATDMTDNMGSRLKKRITNMDWLEILAFAIFGGCIGGPMSHYWNRWYNRNGPKSKSMSMLLDQILVQPPSLLLTYIFLDMTRAAIREIPVSWNRSISHLGSTVALYWRFWPIACYVMLRFLKSRRKYTVAMNLCSLYWMSQLANKRRSLVQRK